MQMKILGRFKEWAEVWREVLHDATAPVDDELRRACRRALLVTFIYIPASAVLVGFIVANLWG